MDWGDWEAMGLTVRSISILGIAMELAITKVCKVTRMLRPLKFSPKTFFARKERKIPRTFKQFRNKTHEGDRNSVFKNEIDCG